MAGTSAIEWTESTWNPVAGCTMVSPGCTNCYAMRMAGRLQAMGLPKYAGTTRRSGKRSVWTGHVSIDERSLNAPLQWRQPQRIFVNSMSDLFQDGVPEHFIERVWHVMAKAHWHSFQILTKRPELMQPLLSRPKFATLSNVWLGTSVESAEYVERLDALRATPAAIRFVSFEPLLGPLERVNLSNIDWAIVGGESGPKARPIERDWVKDVRRQCRDQDVAFFFKQWGGHNKKKSGRRLDGRTYDEYPAPLAAAAGD
jgi:protein gp37